MSILPMQDCEMNCDYQNVLLFFDINEVWKCATFLISVFLISLQIHRQLRVAQKFHNSLKRSSASQSRALINDLNASACHADDALDHHTANQIKTNVKWTRHKIIKVNFLFTRLRAIAQINTYLFWRDSRQQLESELNGILLPFYVDYPIAPPTAFS